MSRKSLFWLFFSGMLAFLMVPSWVLLDGIDALFHTPPPDAPLAVLREPIFFASAGPDNTASEKIAPVDLSFVKFALVAPQAHDVAVAGDFNLWKPDQFPMKRDRRGRWTLEVPVPPGHRRYRFRVDGVWMTDPANPDTLPQADGAVSVRNVP